MGAKKHNKNRVAIKDPALRKKAFEKYCEWIAKGKSPDGFSFEEGGVECCADTIQSYIEKDPVEFPAIKQRIAKAKGFARWEATLEQSADGINTKASTASIQMIMRNKYGWDKLNPNDRERIDTSGLKALSEFFREVSRRPSTQSPSPDPLTPSKAPASTANEPASPGLSLVKTSHVG